MNEWMHVCDLFGWRIWSNACVINTLAGKMIYEAMVGMISILIAGLRLDGNLSGILSFKLLVVNYPLATRSSLRCMLILIHDTNDTERRWDLMWIKTSTWSFWSLIGGRQPAHGVGELFILTFINMSHHILIFWFFPLTQPSAFNWLDPLPRFPISPRPRSLPAVNLFPIVKAAPKHVWIEWIF